MAFIGMRNVIAAKITGETEYAVPAYGASFTVGKAIHGNLTINRGDNPLYADDAIAENDNGVTGMSLEIGVDDITEATLANIGLLTAVTGSGSTATSYVETDEAAMPVGVGYIRVRRKAGVTTYQVIWYYKVLFGRTAENSQTKGETIEWQTPTITGDVIPVDITVDDLVKRVYRSIKNFDTYSDALAALRDYAALNPGAVEEEEAEVPGTGN
jgi:hypothetical protein